MPKHAALNRLPGALKPSTVSPAACARDPSPPPTETAARCSFAGHHSVLMKYDDATKAWDAYGNANWDDKTGMFHFDRRDGICMF